jgi:hypothetical protein
MSTRPEHADLPHFVYRAYDADGVLLYIGATYNPRGRYVDHLGSSIWSNFVKRWRVTGPLPKRSAWLMEWKEIEAVRPLFNTQGIADHLREHLAARAAYLKSDRAQAASWAWVKVREDRTAEIKAYNNSPAALEQHAAYARAVRAAEAARGSLLQGKEIPT